MTKKDSRKALGRDPLGWIKDTTSGQTEGEARDATASEKQEAPPESVPSQPGRAEHNHTDLELEPRPERELSGMEEQDSHTPPPAGQPQPAHEAENPAEPEPAAHPPESDAAPTQPAPPDGHDDRRPLAPEWLAPAEQKTQPLAPEHEPPEPGPSTDAPTDIFPAPVIAARPPEPEPKPEPVEPEAPAEQETEPPAPEHETPTPVVSADAPTDILPAPVIAAHPPEPEPKPEPVEPEAPAEQETEPPAPEHKTPKPVVSTDAPTDILPAPVIAAHPPEPEPEPEPVEPEATPPAEPEEESPSDKARAYLAAHEQSPAPVDIFRKKEEPKPDINEAPPPSTVGWIMAGLCLLMLFLGWMAYARLNGHVEALSKRVTQLEAEQTNR